MLDRNSPLANGLVFAGLVPGGLVGSTLYPDSSLYGRNGTLTGMDPATDWVFDPILGRFTLDFDGTNDWVDCPDEIGPQAGYTAAAWVKPRTTDTGLIIGRYVSIDNAYSQFFQAAGTLYGRICGGGVYMGRSGGTLGTGSWVHVAMRWSGGTTPASVQLYLNGVQSDTDDSTNGTFSAPYSSSTVHEIGSQTNGDTVWPGCIADAMEWGRALSQAEIQQLADPSNVLLGGLILPPRRTIFKSSGTFKKLMIAR